MTLITAEEDLVQGRSKHASDEDTHAGLTVSLSKGKGTSDPILASTSGPAFLEDWTESSANLQITDPSVLQKLSNSMGLEIPLWHWKGSPSVQSSSRNTFKNEHQNIDIARGGRDKKYENEEIKEEMMRNEGEQQRDHQEGLKEWGQSEEMKEEDESGNSHKTASDRERQQEVVEKRKENKQDETEPLQEKEVVEINGQQDFKEAEKQHTGREEKEGNDNKEEEKGDKEREGREDKQTGGNDDKEEENGEMEEEKKEKEKRKADKKETGQNTQSSAAAKGPGSWDRQSEAMADAQVFSSTWQSSAGMPPAKPGTDTLSSQQTRPAVARPRSAFSRCETTGCTNWLLVFLCFSGITPVNGATVEIRADNGGCALQGDPCTMECVSTLAAAPGSTCQWFKNGSPLENSTECFMKLDRLMKSDEDSYQCGLSQGNPRHLLVSDRFPHRVIVFENISLVPEVEVEEGQTVILNCSVHSDPTAFLTWRLGGKTLYTVRSNSDSLVLYNASQYHLQIVECQAHNNQLTPGTLTAKTLIRRNGTFETIKKPSLVKLGTPKLNGSLGLGCLVGELPNQGVNVDLTYTWYKDGKVIEGQSNKTLVIPRLRKEDSGLYTCTATNGKPNTTSPQSNALKINVPFSPVVHIESRTPDNVITQAAAETLNLTCNVTEAFPGVAYDGYRWSYLPSPGGQLRPLEGRESTLTLGPLTREDSGQYICQAWNSEELPPGNASVTVDVVYLGNITLTPSFWVNEGDRVNLTCSVDSNPAARLSWWVEGREVRHVTANVDHYVLERAACSDNKTYTCRASIPHLPGLERNKSTQLLVNCTSNGAQDSSKAWIAAVVVGAVVVTTLVVLLLRKRCRPSRQQSVHQKACCLSPISWCKGLLRSKQKGIEESAELEQFTQVNGTVKMV